MYSKPLVITDNVFLAQRFKETFGAQFPSLHCDYAISKQSDSESFVKAGIDFLTVSLKDSEQLAAIINTYDIVFSIHCKQLFPAALVQGLKCINVHPGYNPHNRGWYPQVFAILYDLPIGATIHEIDEQLDHGPIIARRLVEKYEWDTSDSLYERVQQAEVTLLKETLSSIMAGEYTTIEPEPQGNLFLKKDFNNLCELDLEAQMTMRDAIDRLRALSHGDFRNAFYINAEGSKIYVKLQIEKDGK